MVFVLSEFHNTKPAFTKEHIAFFTTAHIQNLEIYFSLETIQTLRNQDFDLFLTPPIQPVIKPYK